MNSADNVYRLEEFESDPSFEQIISENQQKIQNLIYSMTNDYQLSQDLTQEAFIKAFNTVNTFQGKSKFSTWLYRIAVNLTIDYQRKSSTRNESVRECTDSLAVSDKQNSDPDNTCQKNAIKQILFSAITKLPDQQREVFVLREVNGYSTKEVSGILKCSVELVKWRLHKARIALRKILQSENNYEKIGKLKLNGLELE